MPIEINSKCSWNFNVIPMEIHLKLSWIFNEIPIPIEIIGNPVEISMEYQ